MASIYNNHLTVSHTLNEFTNRLSNLFADEEYDAFIRAGLTGEYCDEAGINRQIFIDPLRNYVPGDHSITVTRDYDSAIGISDRILVNCDINVYAVPHPTHSLTSSIHIKYPIERPGVSSLLIQ